MPWCKLPWDAIFKMKMRERQTTTDMKNMKTPEDFNACHHPMPNYH